MIDLLPDGKRKMPDTRPDEESIGHYAACLCDVCKRPAAQRLKKQKTMALLQRNGALNLTGVEHGPAFKALKE